MSDALIAFLLAAGGAAWVYSKISRTSGGNTTSSATAAGIAGLFIFLLALFILGLIPSN